MSPQSAQTVAEKPPTKPPSDPPSGSHRKKFGFGRGFIRLSQRAVHRSRVDGTYPLWFLVPGVALFVVFFVVPTVVSFYFSLTRWDLMSAEYIGFDNYIQFFKEEQLMRGFTNTFIYGVVTSGAKVVIGMGLAVLLSAPILGRGYLRSVVFFPVLVSTVGVGITFKALLDPFYGVVNQALSVFGIAGPGWLTDPQIALLSVAAIDVWKGVGIATLIFMAGIAAIPQEYYEAAKVDGASGWRQFVSITLPLSAPATGTVVLLSLISGLRSFDLIWATTKGGPGFTTDVIASVIYKQYQAGFYGLSTAGNVILFIVVTVIIVPLAVFINRKSESQ